MDRMYQIQMMQDHIIRLRASEIFESKEPHLAEAKRHLNQVWLSLDDYKKRSRRVILVDGGTIIGRGMVENTRGELVNIRLDDGGSIEVDINQVELVQCD